MIDLIKKSKLEVAISIIDFSSFTYQAEDFSKGQKTTERFYDLASLTKIFTGSLCYFKYPNKFSKDMMLLLNHKGGLPSGGRLPKKGWEDQILNYKISESPTLYSDYSALRLMLELEKIFNKNIRDLIEDYLSSYFDFIYNLEVLGKERFLASGFRNNHPILKEVNDHNANIIGRPTSHAGIFATITGISNAIIKMEKEFQFLKKLKDAYKKEDEYVLGFNVATPSGLSGSNILNTFGHLGFTGTSLWVNSDLKKGLIILTNACKDFFYDRNKLNELRRSLGALIFGN